jgi:hypothetical protein
MTITSTSPPTYQSIIYDAVLIVGRVRLRIWLFFLLVVVAAEIMIFALGDAHYFVMESVYIVWLLCMPSVILWARRVWIRGYDAYFRRVQYQHPGLTCIDWLRRKHDLIFTLKSGWSVLGPVVVGVLGAITVIPQPNMYGNQLVNAVAAAGFFMVLLEAGHFAYMVIAAILCLFDTLRVTASAERFSLESDGIRTFESSWLTFPVLTALAYSAVLIATIFSPYGLSFPFNLWLLLLSAMPIVASGASFYGIRRIRRKLKMQQLSEVLQQLATKATDPSDREMTALSNTYVIAQAHAQVREWPVSSLVASSLFVGAVPVLGSVLTTLLIK